MIIVYNLYILYCFHLNSLLFTISIAYCWCDCLQILPKHVDNCTFATLFYNWSIQSVSICSFTQFHSILKHKFNALTLCSIIILNLIDVFSSLVDCFFVCLGQPASRFVTSIEASLSTILTCRQIGIFHIKQRKRRRRSSRIYNINVMP